MTIFQKIKRMRHLLKKALFLYKTEGFKGIRRGYVRYKKFIKTATEERKRELLDGVSMQNAFVKYFDPTEENVFSPEALSRGQKLTINWVVPDYKTPSGGHMNIFRMIRYLEQFGHKNRVYIFDVGAGLSYKDSIEAKDAIDKHFTPINAEVILGVENMKESDIVVATSWHTAYPVYAIKNTKQKFYFIQDYEPLFYSVGSEYVFAEQTYKMGYKCITAGPWLTKIMREKYHASSEYFWLAYDKAIYKKKENIQKDGKTIAFCGRFVTPRRGFELGILALEKVKKERPDANIIIYGWDTSNQNIPFEHKSVGIMNHEQLAELYNKADIGLVFSMTNYSLIPQEMMACGLPVVEFKGDNTEEVYKDQENVLLADANPHSVAKKVIALLDYPDKRKELTRNASVWVDQFDWEESARMVEEAFYNLSK